MQTITTNSVPASVVFNAEPVAAAFAKFADSFVAMADAKKVILEAFPKGLTYEQFEGRRKMVISALVAAKLSSNEDNAARMFNRVKDELGFEKPKATSAKAVENAEKKAKKDAAIADLAKGKTMQELAALAATGNELAADAMKQRAKEQGKEQAEKVKATRKATKEQIDNAAPEVVETVSAMIPQAAAFAKIMGALRLLAKDMNCATFDEKVIDAACERIKAKRQIVKKAA